MTNQEAISVLELINARTDYFLINDYARAKAIDMAISVLQEQDVPDTTVRDMVSRRAAIDALMDEFKRIPTNAIRAKDALEKLPSAQLEIIRCKDCTYGVQDEYGRWYCRSLGCQIGDEDGNGFCSDAERRTDEGSD